MRGIASRNSTLVGALYPATRSLQCAMMSASVTVAPATGTTKALMVSPHLVWGTPITATSATSGWLKMVSSTSMDDTFSPPVMITSFFRSEIVRWPSDSSTQPPSPVWNQSSSRTASVSSGFSQ